MDLGIDRVNFHMLSEVGYYVYAILQQRYTFDGTEITDGSGDIWIFANHLNAFDTYIFYKRVPYNYTIQQIKNVAWKQAANDFGQTNNFYPSGVVQSPNGRIWVGGYYEPLPSLYAIVTYFDGTSWQNWTRVNNTTIPFFSSPDITLDGTDLLFSWLVQGVIPYPTVTAKLHYKSFSQSADISTLACLPDTELFD